jgi:hypothetical protein
MGIRHEDGVAVTETGLPKWSGSPEEPAVM